MDGHLRNGRHSDMRCVCIKDGYMDNGLKFCDKGEIYDYDFCEIGGRASYPYSVNTESDVNYGGCRSHSMGAEFFDTYFAVYDGFLGDELFTL